MMLILIAVLILQIIMLLISPLFKYQWPFSLYYKHVFMPLFQDNEKLRWKFYLVPLFYSSIYLGVVHLAIRSVIPQLSSGLHFVDYWFFIPFFIVLTPATGILAAIIGPETTKNYKRRSADEFKYDYLLFYPNIKCRTCQLPKPARSKHCNVCNQCILAVDHHCIWINNCVGLGNYLYFYSFLVLNSLAMSYAFIRSIFIVWLTPHIRYPKSILAFNLLTGCFALICIVFTYLQLSMVREGMTTNEKDKWFTVHEYMREKRLVRSSNGRWYYDLTEQLDLPPDQHEFFSTNPYDGRVYRLHNYTLIEDAEQINNIYDEGSFTDNLRTLCLT
ncbi:hypothetical protein ZYGR_0AK02820 [Zygosaccharomyces rouxii]|uniref:Palmitoyltransferase n=1 Tax=Zygosaccharomyces rouxii TaxID=4956 RepID=A0A1Q3ADQ7_ZYGRO|nr:hypothetical protein ZYGR_0AK02820 [Zygosaccharomyces rouxii]